MGGATANRFSKPPALVPWCFGNGHDSRHRTPSVDPTGVPFSLANAAKGTRDVD